ncbi:MAG: hypothetical protein JXQ83_15095 [Candidatus Glassbacteria bacterium]|nr:hypothetical protein [Candidatus Glassbacteria bacterium]
MDIGTAKVIGIILLVVIGAGYFLLVTAINSKLRRDSRVARFRVGGTPYKPEGKPGESREERRKRGEVSLRDGRMWKRRFK